MKLGRLKQNHKRMRTSNWKLEVESQEGGRLFSVNGSSNNSAMD